MGTNLVSTDTVQWNGTNLVTTFVSATEVDAAVPASMLTLPSTPNVDVETKDGYQTSDLPFTINATASIPGAPNITSITAASAVAGDPNLTLLVSGKNFVAGDVVELNGVSESTTFVSPTQLTASIPAVSISTTGDLPVTVVDRLGNRSNSVPFRINPVHTYDVGIQMITAPFDYSGDALSAIIDEPNAQAAVWNPSTNEYDITPTPPADTIHEGQGAWVHFLKPVNLLIKGVDLTAGTGKLTLPLTAGWNMIGDPYSVPAPLSSFVIIDSGGNRLTLAQANAQGIVYSTLYSYNSATGQYDSHDSDSLQPYRGYWIDAFANCKIEMPTPNGNNPH